jgi:hypothetical protein
LFDQIDHRQQALPVAAEKLGQSPRVRWSFRGDAQEWTEDGSLRQTIVDWARNRGKDNPRLYPASLIWCIRKPGRDLRNKVEILLAWRNVNRDYIDGTLPGEFDKSDGDEIKACLRDAEESAQDEVWTTLGSVTIPRTDKTPASIL